MSVTRRGFIAGMIGASCLLVPSCAGGAGNAGNAGSEPGTGRMPGLPAPEPEGDLGIDANINMSDIDEWLGRDDVCYRDMRMLVDPAHYEEVGGGSRLTAILDGFTVVPYPYIGTLAPLPVEGAYDGDRLFDVEWKDGEIVSAKPRYEESELFVEDMFPRDKAIFLMCGGGGYSDMMRRLLVFLGHDPRRIYNVGGYWGYTGDRDINMITYSKDAGGAEMYATWRAPYALIDFDRLHPLP